MPGFGQYAGPAILSRGEAPAAMSAPQIRFQPYVSVSAIYASGLSGVAVTNAQGELGVVSSTGVNLGWGVSGVHSWKHTKLSVNYTGSLTHYTEQSSFDSVNQSLMFSVDHQFSPHTSVFLRQSAGIFSRQFGLEHISETVPFDPASTYIPTTDYFDNRTIYSTTQAGFLLQKTARLSFEIGGAYFLADRRSSALHGTRGHTATGDAQYRISRRSTVGANYTYGNYTYSGVAGGTDIHMFAGTFAMRLTRFIELSSFAGIARVESKFLQQSALDPAIAALLGITSSFQVVHSIRYIPYWSVRVSRTFRTGVAYVSGGHTVVPGNGLFLTSFATTVLGGYNYTGLRRWSFSAQGAYVDASATGTITGSYSSQSGALAMSRHLGRMLHLTMSYTVRQYNSGTYARYNRLISNAQLGLTFAPGDVPLRFW